MPDGSQFSEMKVQPHSIEAEQALLGALLLNNGILDRVINLIDQEHFYDPLHAHLYMLIKHFVGKDKLASPVTLKPLISIHEGFEQVGGATYLVRCAETVISATAAPEYALLIRDCWARRCAIEVGTKIIDSAGSTRDPDETTDTIIDIAEGSLAKLRTDTTTQRTLISYRDAMAEGLDLASEAYNRGGVPEISTGLDNADELLGGLQRGRLIVLGGRTAMGKTALALALAGNVADQGRGVVFASFEMPPFEIAQRYASATSASLGTQLPYRDLSGGDMKEDQFRKIIEHARDTEDRPIQIVGEENKEIGRLRAAIRTAHRGFERQGTPLGLIVVDYIQLLRAPHTHSQVENVSYCARDLKSIAKTYNVPVIGLSQVKREVDERKDRRPGLSDLRWAGEIEEAADQVMFVYRQSYYDDRDARELEDDEERAALKFRADQGRRKMEILVEKNRGGPTGARTIWADLPTNRICNEDPTKAPDPRQTDMEGFK